MTKKIAAIFLVVVAVLLFVVKRKRSTNPASDTGAISIGQIGSNLTLVENSSTDTNDYAPFGLPGKHDGQRVALSIGNTRDLKFNIYSWSVLLDKWTYEYTVNGPPPVPTTV